MDVDAPPSAEVVADSAFDTSPLPKNHPTKFLDEARSEYHDSRPPFVSSGNGHTEGFEKEVFIANNGQRPLLPIRAKITAKRWGPLATGGTYWTLDLNGERVIVTPFPNNGCIKGAKWVYCAWTGAGEEFEDMPLAFTCINGEYTSAAGLKTGSAAAAKRATIKDDKKDTATSKVTPLPEDHPVEHLDEAAALYVNSRPPFVIHQTKIPRRPVRLATEDGRFSATGIEAEIVYRVWDPLDDFATLDLNGKRFIVMGNAGGAPGGYQYRLWLGSEAGRDKKAIAYGGPPVIKTKKPLESTERLSEMDKDSILSSSPDDEEAEDSEDTTEPREYSYDNFRGAFETTATRTSMPVQFRSRRSTLSPESSAPRRRSHREARLSKRARSSTPPAHCGSGKDQRPAKLSKRAPRGNDRVPDDSPGFSDAPYETPAPTPSTNDRSAPVTETPNPQTQVPDSLPSLSLYKQTHTTLRVTRDSNIIGFVPLRLLTCMSMATLFSGVVAASGHKERDEPIKCLMAMFDWKDENDVYKTIYVDKGTPGSFEIFLEIIDEAPCWKDEGGKCGIAVEIVRA